LFIALPGPLVRAALEREIGRIRESRARGLAAVERVGEGLGSGEGGMREEEEEEALGGTAEGKFNFEVMKEWNVHIDVVGGSVIGEGESGDVEGWWDWVAAQL
jgi:signal recognition particle receptor subunit beta